MHLARLGRTDVLVLEQGELISGTTSHAPGLIGQLRSSKSLTQLLADSVALYRTLQLDGVPGFLEVGSLRIASSRGAWPSCVARRHSPISAASRHICSRPEKRMIVSRSWMLPASKERFICRPTDPPMRRCWQGR